MNSEKETHSKCADHLASTSLVLCPFVFHLAYKAIDWCHPHPEWGSYFLYH